MNQLNVLLNHLTAAYFANLTSVLIVYDSSYRLSTCNDYDAVNKFCLQELYLDAIQHAFDQQTQRGHVIGLQWIDTRSLNSTQYEEVILNAVNLVTKGFITVLTNSTAFLHARYSATRNARLRLKDKYYLFLCEHEDPVEFLGNELLQFYPHHLLVVPSSENSNYEIKQNKADRIPKARNVVKQTSWSSGNATIKTTSVVTTTEGTSVFRNCKQCSVHRNFNFELWTQKYVGTAGNLDAEHLDTYVASERTFLKNTELYPDKLTKLHGRTLRMGSHTYLPYTVTNYVPPGTGNVDAIDSQAPNRTVSFIGSEAELIISFCQNYDCHLRVEPYGENAWGDVYDNGTGVGMFGGLFAQHIECAIGSMYDWYHDLYEVSHEIAATTIKLVTPGPAQYPRWRIIIMPFSLEAWMVIALAILLYSLIFQFIKYTAYRLRQTRSLQKNKYRYVKHFLKTLLDVFAVFIQQPSADTSLHRFASRVCLAALLFATLTLENTYSGQLKSFLTAPLFTDPVDTIDKWTKTNWKWTAPSMEWIINIEQSDLVKDQILTQKFEMNDLDFLYNASFRDDYGLGIEGLFSGSFTFGKYITAPALEGKIVTKDALYYAWTVAACMRGWPLIPLLNRHISHCFETGLYIHWEKEAAAQILDHHTHDILGKLAAGYKPSSPPQKLTIESISGALFLLLFGYFVAFLAFFSEILCWMLKNKINNKIQFAFA